MTPFWLDSEALTPAEQAAIAAAGARFFYVHDTDGHRVASVRTLAIARRVVTAIGGGRIFNSQTLEEQCVAS